MLVAITLALGLKFSKLSTPGVTFSTAATGFSDRTNIGTLEVCLARAHDSPPLARLPLTRAFFLCRAQVPRMGVGTIAWGTDSLDDEARIAAVADAALSSGLTMFDTAERYGAKGSALIPAALAAVGLPVQNDYLGGDTESRQLELWLPGF